MSLLPSRYALDYTGKSKNNLIENELREVASSGMRILCPGAGAYFSDTLTIMDVAAGNPLERGVDWVPYYVCAMPTCRSGQPVHAMIVITSGCRATQVALTYNCLGDDHASQYEALASVVIRSLSDGRRVLFENILGHPDELEPTKHLHTIGQGVGFEYMVEAIERVRSAIILGDQIDHERILAYVESCVSQLSQSQKAVENDLFMLSAAHAGRSLTASTQLGVELAELTQQMAVVKDQARITQQYVRAQEYALEDQVRQAEDLIRTYDASESAKVALGLRSTPTVASPVYLTRPGEVGKILAVSDYSVNNIGQVSLKSPSADTLFWVHADLSVNSDGKVQLNLEVGSADTRAAGGDGNFVESDVTLYPLLWPVAAGKLRMVQPQSPTARVGRLTDRVDPGTPWRLDAVDTGFVRGFGSGPTAPSADGAVICGALMDMRRDYNVDRIGGSDPRSGVTFRLAPGSVVYLSAVLSAPSEGDLTGRLAVGFHHRTNIMRSVSGVITPVLTDVSREMSSFLTLGI